MLSMTGFGRGEASDQGFRVSVEVSGINRKQADIVPQVPKGLASEWDTRIRKRVQECVSRGRVVISVEVASDGVSVEPHVDRDKARAFFKAIAELEMLRGETIQVSPSDLADFFHLDKDVAADAEAAWPVCQTALDQALDAFNTMRRREGDHLLEDLRRRRQKLADHVESIAARAPAVVERYREALRQRLEEAGLDLPLDDERLLREIGIFAERSDISEELTRLRSHLSKFEAFFAAAEPVGRPLDFLCQETHREINTIGSKANDATLAQLVVDSKTELEKLREQVQNIE